MGIIAYFEFGYDCVEVDSNGIGKEGCFYLTQMELNNLHVLNICKNDETQPTIKLGTRVVVN